MRFVLCVLSFCLTAPAASAAPALRTCNELFEALRTGDTGRFFDISAQVSHQNPYTKTFTLLDGNELANINALVPNLLTNGPTLRQWDRVRVTGHTTSNVIEFLARCETIEVLGPGPAQEPTPFTIQGLFREGRQGQYVRLRGEVDDLFSDEVDARYGILVLKVDEERIFVLCPVDFVTNTELLGATVEIDCHYSKISHSTRVHFNKHVTIDGKSDLRVISRLNDYPFSTPLLGSCENLRPQDIASLDRRRITGRVTAIWDVNRILVMTPDRQPVRVRLASMSTPALGADIEAVGFPETDLYRVNLTRAVWRQTETATRSAAPSLVTNLPISVLSPLTGEKVSLAPRYLGRILRLTGIVGNRSRDATGREVFTLRDGDHGITIDRTCATASVDGIDDGAHVEVTGVLVFDAEVWRPNLILPRITDVRLIPRSASDFRILTAAPLWTVQRLLILVILLLSVLAGVAVWNLLLRRLVERRSRQLADETIARTESDLKVYERTRLAVELHDSLSQTLTGVVMEIRAAGKTLNTDLPRVMNHLFRAERTVNACRSELKNCIWDLRNDAMGEADMNEAIRRTLAPHLGDARLTVRFSVPRDRLTDNTAHTILRVVRELAINAVRHGHATHIRVAGAIEGQTFLFSVADNGCGFDPETAPGISDGHFGLQGIRERISGLEGSFSLVSSAGKGTKATVSISVPGECPS